MMERRRLWAGLCLGVFIVLAAAACSQEDSAVESPRAEPDQEIADHRSNEANKEAPQDPIALELYQYSARLTDDEFLQFFKEPVETQFPHITIELVRSGSGMNLTDLAASGEWPDLFYTGFRGLRNFLTVAAAQDLTDLVKKVDLDLEQFDATALQAIYNYSSGQQLYALPMFNNFSVLYYNKDVFDQFGAPYPEDGMTWDEAFDLIKHVTRNQDGNDYYGLAVDGGVVRLGEQLSLPFADPVTNKATLQTDGWRTVFETFRTIHEIPGHQARKGKNAFIQDRNVAMLASYGATLGELEELHKQGNPIHYDLAAIPSFSDAPNKGFASSSFILGVFVTSEWQDAAIEVISYLSTDVPFQMMASQYGKLTSMQNVEVKEQFGAAMQSLQGKNIAAIIESELAPLPPFSLYEHIPQDELYKAMDAVIDEGMDVNSALRQAEEAANLRIEQELKAQ